MLNYNNLPYCFILITDLVQNKHIIVHTLHSISLIDVILKLWSRMWRNICNHIFGIQIYKIPAISRHLVRNLFGLYINDISDGFLY